MGVLQRVTRRLTGQDDVPPVDPAPREEITPTSALQDRRPAVVEGVVREVSVGTVGEDGVVLRVRLEDSEGEVVLSFLGRRRIRGIEVGVRLKARSRVTLRRGRPTMINPAYEIVPGR